MSRTSSMDVREIDYRISLLQTIMLVAQQNCDDKEVEFCRKTIAALEDMRPNSVDSERR